MKNIFLYHILASGIAALSFFWIKPSITNFQLNQPAVPIPGKAAEKHIDHFHDNDLKAELNLSVNLATGIPVLFGSSELTSRHLRGLAPNYFNKEKKQKLFAFGHAGFQNFAIMTALAANRSLLKNARVVIILSPSWFEGKYAKGTSLNSFFEYCPESYLYTIYNDKFLDHETKTYIAQFICSNYEKITAPSDIHRLFAHKGAKFPLINYPFVKFNEEVAHINTKREFNLTIQETILNKITVLQPGKQNLNCITDNWDSLLIASSNNFKSLSNNNSYGVENDYYTKWMGNGQKKELDIVPVNKNKELEDFRMLIRFLKLNKVKPLFIISPLNTLAHSNIKELTPVIESLKNSLGESEFRYLDLFTPNVNDYKKGVLEDIMHLYDCGWYQVDKFIADNLYCSEK